MLGGERRDDTEPGRPRRRCVAVLLAPGKPDHPDRVLADAGGIGADGRVIEVAPARGSVLEHEPALVLGVRLDPVDQVVVVLFELLVPYVIGPPQISDVLGCVGVVVVVVFVVDVDMVRVGEVEHELTGQPPGRTALPGDRRPVPAHHERDVEVVVLAGPGEPGLVA